MSVVIAIAAVGAVNWGLVGALDFNLVTALFGSTASGASSIASRVVYTIVGVAGIIAVALACTMRLAYPLRSASSQAGE